MSTMKDGGKREQFKTGAHREPRQIEKGDFSLISPIMLRRLAVWSAMGAEKYGRRNWEKGIPLDGCLDSCLRHINKYREGKRDEDHLTAAIWNLMAVIHLQEVMPETDNIPSYALKHDEKKEK